MKGKTSGESFDSNTYQNPQQDWLCGHHCDGTPCAIGPNGNGECTAAQICAPALDDAGWHCTRAKAWGGRCKEGPIPDPNSPDTVATCPHQPVPCQPQRSLRSKRRLATGIIAALAFGFCLIVLGGSSNVAKQSLLDTSSVVSPGELSRHHASLEQGCAACHSAASASPMSILSCALGSSDGLKDSRKCLECHQDYGEHAFHAHGVSPDRLKTVSEALIENGATHTARQRLTRLPGDHGTIASGELACSTCHVEHQGASFNLTALTNAQCQSCHSSTFHSFAKGHPEFTERDRPFLYFDHATHFRQHFDSRTDDSSGALSCSDCHINDSGGSSMVLASFETTCAQCHAKQITDHHMPQELRMPGTEFLTLSANKPLPPLMEILLQGNTNDAAIAELMSDLAANRESAVTERLASINGDVENRRFTEIAEQLEQTGFFEALRRLQTVEQPTDPDGVPPVTDANSGAWSIEDAGKSLTYRSRGHADPFLRHWLSLAAAAASSYPEEPAGDSSGAFDRLFQQLAAPEASGRCMKCHTMDALASGRNTINWRSRQVMSTENGFTRFNHGPHLTLLNNGSQAHAMGSSKETQCETCHSVGETQPLLRNDQFVLDDWMPNPDFHHSSSSGVSHVTKASCAKCHTSQQAGDSCLQCHNYHVHASAMDER